MPTYETIFITLPDLTDQEEETLVGGMLQVVTDGGGSLTANERLGRRRLAYPIRKFEDGVYTRFLYDSEPSVPRELERRFGLLDKILRHLTVRMEEEWAEASKVQAVRDAKARAEAAAAAKQREAEEREKAKEEEKKAKEKVQDNLSAGAGSSEASTEASVAEAPAAEEADAGAAEDNARSAESESAGKGSEGNEGNER